MTELRKSKCKKGKNEMPILEDLEHQNLDF